MFTLLADTLTSTRALSVIILNPSEAGHSPQDYFTRLAAQLRRMINLEKLVFDIQERHTEAFATELMASGTNLPKVRHLVIGPFCHFVISACPNVETVATVNHWGSFEWPEAPKNAIRIHTKSLIESLKDASNIHRLKLHESWNIQILEAIYGAVPRLQSLALASPTPYSDLPITGFPSALSKFENLRQLILPAAWLLDVGFFPPECVNFYMNPDGSEIEEVVAMVDQEQREAEIKVLDMVAPVCPSLRELWIGNDTRAEIVRNANGRYLSTVWHGSEDIDRAVDWLGV